jgi:hypothetical protein
MIIGRTPGGLIKTKTAGGLRAVNCACCGGPSCAITEAQFNTIRYGGTTNIAAPFQTTFVQDYEYSFFDAEGNETIFGQLSGNQIFSNINPYMRNCVYNFPPPMPGTYTVPTTLSGFAAISVIILYSAIIPADPNSAKEYYLGVGLNSLYQEGCFWCSGVEPDDLNTYSKIFLEPPCGIPFYKALMEADPTYLVTIPSSPCP